jgi:hypothetical protein
MDDSKDTNQPPAAHDFDYSTPEAQQALSDVTALVLEIRNEYGRSLRRKITLYERTLGLAVAPVLLRRAVIVVGRKIKRTFRRP